MNAPRHDPKFVHGRGPVIDLPNRFTPLVVTPDPEYSEFDDHGVPIERPLPRTQFFPDSSQSVLNHFDSTDIGPGWGLNPYRGCEHGCAYCYARPFHDYLGWSSGIEFETKILVKLRVAELLRAELSSPKWQPETIMLSGITDVYQPAERHFRLTRACLEVLAELRHPVGIITKNFLITRDLDLLRELARWNCVSVSVSVTTLDADLCGKLEPRASRPEHRLRAIKLLTAAGVRVGVNVAPVIPGLTDHELPAILEAAAGAGATRATFITLRLPHSVKDVFLQWLDTHEPGKRDRVLSRLRDLHGGKLYNSNWGDRLRGDGIFAEQIQKMFEIHARRLGLESFRRSRALSTEHFRRPGGTQLELL